MAVYLSTNKSSTDKLWCLADFVNFKRVFTNNDNLSLSSASMLTHVHYNYMSLAAYVNALFWAIMPVFGWARYEEDPGSGCALDWNRGGASYISYLFTLFVVRHHV